MINFWGKIKNYNWLTGWRPYLLIFTIGFLLYSQTLFFNYTYFDDSTLIVDNQEVLSDIKNIGRIFSSDVFFSSPPNRFYYRPFLNLSLMIDSQLGLIDSQAGDLTFIFHFFNVLFHLLAASLVCYLLQRLYNGRALAFILSLFFLVHPALAPAVAWLPGRNDSLLAIFVLVAFIIFLNFLERPRLSSYFGYLALFFCALLTKESAIGLPLLLIFYWSFVEKGIIILSDKFLLLLGSGAVIFIWLIMRQLAFGGDLVGASGHLASFSAIWQTLPALLIFAGKLILPFDLSVLPTLKDAHYIWGWLGLVAVTVGALIFPPRRPKYFWFGVFWVGLFLLPSFLNPDTSAGFLSHRLYLSFFGWLLILGQFQWLSPPVYGRRYVLIISLILAFLSLLTVLHSQSFRDRLVFWRQAVSDSPGAPLAQRNLGVMYYFEGKMDLAEVYYRQALKLNPKEPMVHNNLGVLYLGQKKYSEARTEFLNELKTNPGYDKAISNLGLVQSLMEAGAH